MNLDNDEEIKHPDVRTANGAPAFSSTYDELLDLFMLGATRGAPRDRIHQLMGRAWHVSPVDTLRILLQCRHCRGGGKGERDASYAMMGWVKTYCPMVYEALLTHLVSVGGYRDLRALVEDEEEDEEKLSTTPELRLLVDRLLKDRAILNGHGEGLAEGSDTKISLAAKWAPKERSGQRVGQKGHKLRSDKLARVCSKLVFPGDRQHRKKYRKLLSRCNRATYVTEVLLSSRQEEKIDLAKVPARAMKLYRKALEKKIPEKLAGYHKAVKEALARPLDASDDPVEGAKVAKINAEGVDPYELVFACLYKKNVDDTLRLQWATKIRELRQNRPLVASLSKALAIVDVSGSMRGIPMAAAIAMGLIICNVSEGPFRGKFITFSSNPSFVTVDTALDYDQQVESMSNAQWGCSTDLVKTFRTILDQARAANVPPADMPDAVFLFTDGQFDSMVSNRYPFQEIDRMYQAAGYPRPRLIYWNLNGRYSNVPCLHTMPNVVMMNGFNPKAMMMVLENPAEAEAVEAQMAALSLAEREKAEQERKEREKQASIRTLIKTIEPYLPGVLKLDDLKRV